MGAMPTLRVNGKRVEFQPGDVLLKVLLESGIFVPHYCYHPGLSPEGNCRMCLVKTNQSRKLEVSCMMRCNEKMEIETEPEEVKKARADVMEFLLINHPLDCPICDKAGECDLQDFTFTYRGGLSRFVEGKTIRHTKDLGPDIAIWGNRCIACSRCVRFCEEIPGTGELALINRGDRSVIDIFPGVPIDNPMSLNVVDICPVGALIDKNFLFQQRVWMAPTTGTVCTHCSRGCNMELLTFDNAIKRFRPRFNPDVNGYWACDEGRLHPAFVGSERRLRTRRGTVTELAEALAAHAGEGLAAVCSASHTVEELFLFKKLVDALEIKRVGVLTRSRGERWASKSGWTIEEDGTSNRAFAGSLIGQGGLEPIIEAIEQGEIKRLFWMNAIPACAWGERLAEAVAKLEFFAAVDLLDWPIYRTAQIVLPGCAFAEKDGTVVNTDGRIQRLRRAIDPPGDARPEVETLQELLKALEKRTRVLSAEGVFREAAKEVQPLAGLDYGKIGDQGIPLHLEAVTA